MKGKLVYTTIVEKEIEIPDEVIDAFDTIATTYDHDAYTVMDEFSVKAWANADGVVNRLSIEFEQDGKWWTFEQY